MKGILFATLILFTSQAVYCQQEDVETLYSNAKEFMQQGDYANASLILVRALEVEPGNLKVAKDLALNYYMQNENGKGLKVLQPFLSKNRGDDQTFQIAGMLYKRMGQAKDAEKIYKSALKIFPSSGPLYNDYGELLWTLKDYSAVNLWEKGIKEDPTYPGNYYHAAKYYYLSKDKVWSLLYGEIFVNLESTTSRTAEMKNILLDGYKKLYVNTDLLENTRGLNKFEIAFLTSMNKQNDVVIRGINAETLTMIRTRFILDWDQHSADKYPYIVFALQKQLLREGLFPAYNQWLFGAAQNLGNYQIWMNTHGDEYEALQKYFQKRNFSVPEDQFYH